MTSDTFRAVVLTAVLVLSSMAVGVSITGPAVADHDSTKLTVDGVGNQNGHYATVQAAVDNASADDTVVVQSGTYYINTSLEVNVKNLTIRAEAGATPEIRVRDNTYKNLLIRADGVTVSGFDFVTNTSVATNP